MRRTTIRLSIATSKPNTFSVSPKDRASASKAKRNFRGRASRGSERRTDAIGPARPNSNMNSRRTNTCSSSSDRLFQPTTSRTSPTWITATRSTFGGLFGEIRYLLLDRGPSSPLAITLSMEPNWRRSDETTGQRVTNFELEFKVNADLELIQEPALSRQPICSTNRRRPTIRIISGRAGRRNRPAACPVPCLTALSLPVFVGAEVWYLRHYDGIWFNTYTGDAVYLGPTHLRATQFQGVRHCGLEYANHRPRCRHSGLHAQSCRIFSPTRQIEIGCRILAGSNHYDFATLQRTFLPLLSSLRPVCPQMRNKRRV